VIVLVEDIQPEWKLGYGVRMKLTSVCSKRAPTCERLSHRRFIQ
jgi:hypothetical protein